MNTHFMLAAAKYILLLPFLCIYINVVTQEVVSTILAFRPVGLVDSVHESLRISSSSQKWVGIELYTTQTAIVASWVHGGSLSNFFSVEFVVR